jgi:hypothetical protein
VRQGRRRGRALVAGEDECVGACSKCSGTAWVQKAAKEEAGRRRPPPWEEEGEEASGGAGHRIGTSSKRCRLYTSSSYARLARPLTGQTHTRWAARTTAHIYGEHFFIFFQDHTITYIDGQMDGQMGGPARPNNRARPGRPAGRPVGPGLAYMALTQAVPSHRPVRPNRPGGPLE